jgi:hypothetical protein
MVNTSKFPRKINIEHNSGVRKKTNQFDIELGEWIQNAIDKGWISLSISPDLWETNSISGINPIDNDNARIALDMVNLPYESERYVVPLNGGDTNLFDASVNAHGFVLQDKVDNGVVLHLNGEINNLFGNDGNQGFVNHLGDSPSNFPSMTFASTKGFVDLATGKVRYQTTAYSDNELNADVENMLQSISDGNSGAIIESTTRNARAFTELRSEIYENDSLVDGQVAEVKLWATQFLDTPSVARKGQAIVNLIRNHENSKVELSTRKLDDSNITSFLLESPESGDSEATLVADKLTINTNIINFTNLPEYADDTAAGIGGLVVGDLYSTSGAVMIKL